MKSLSYAKWSSTHSTVAFSEAWAKQLSKEATNLQINNWIGQYQLGFVCEILSKLGAKWFRLFKTRYNLKLVQIFAFWACKQAKPWNILFITSKLSIPTSLQQSFSHGFVYCMEKWNICFFTFSRTNMWQVHHTKLFYGAMRFKTLRLPRRYGFSVGWFFSALNHPCA